MAKYDKKKNAGIANCKNYKFSYMITYTFQFIIEKFFFFKCIYNRKVDRKKNGPASKLMLQAYA
jgi:hypothetical protein